MNPEAVAPPATLFDMYADTQVTVYGVTGTLGELRGLCPVDPSEMSPEAMDRFSAVVLQQAGVEIPEEFAYLTAPQAEAPTKASSKQSAEATKATEVTEEPAATAADLAPKRVLQPVEELTRTVIPAPSDEAAGLKPQLITDERTTLESFKTTSPISEVLLATTTEQLTSARDQQSQAEFAPTPSPLSDSHDHKSESVQATIAIETAESTPVTAATPETEIFEAFTAPEAIAEPVELATHAEQPTALLDTFIDSLRAFDNEEVESSAPHEGFEVFFTEGTKPFAENSQTPSIVGEVVERLTLLLPDEKKAVMPIVQDITAVTKQLAALRVAEAPPEEIMAAEEKLTELVVQLFETIGIAYDEAKIEQFVQTLLHPEFAKRSAPVKAGLFGLEGLGTHEIKRYFKEFFAMLTGLLARVPTRQLLGMFAVFRASPALHANTWAYVAT